MALVADTALNHHSLTHSLPSLVMFLTVIGPSSSGSAQSLWKSSVSSLFLSWGSSARLASALYIIIFCSLISAWAWAWPCWSSSCRRWACSWRSCRSSSTIATMIWFSFCTSCRIWSWVAAICSPWKDKYWSSYWRSLHAVKRTYHSKLMRHG